MAVSLELRRRVLTAVVALPACVALLWLGGWPASALFSVASALACWEFLRLARAQRGLPDAFALAAAAVLPWLPLWAPASAAVLALLLVGASSFVAWGWHVVRQDVTGAASDAPLVPQALVFCGLGPFFLASLRAGDAGWEWSLAVVAATFANDTGAYAVGRWRGRHRLAPKVSPGKTWEGAAGGALASMLVAAGAVAWWPHAFRVRDALVLAVSCAFLGPLGDLSKSALKRARGVKDAGAILPGHGGMLDRIDALVVNVPVFWAWAQWGR
jgi:phosphatidate cytidylyltransferase